jgi:hypothetical protein
LALEKSGSTPFSSLNSEKFQRRDIAWEKLALAPFSGFGSEKSFSAEM